MSLTADSFAAFLEGNSDTLTRGAVCDFGLDRGIAFHPVDQSVLVLYRIAWRSGLISVQDLREASTSGPKLTAMLRKVPTLKQVTISTVYDSMANV